MEKKRSPWLWVPSLYFAEGIPYVVVMTVSVIMYKRLGLSNTDIALYTSWLYLPWVIKPLWSPLVDILKTRRFWIIVMQLVVGAGLGGVALTLPLPGFFQYTLAFLWLLAFSSATHDIAADGFYMLALQQHEQAFFVGIRSTFYRLAMITGQGLLIILAGYLESLSGLPTVEVRVNADPRAQVGAVPVPDSLKVTAQPGALRLVAHPATLQIAAVPRPQSEVDSLLARARAWNLQHGFYQVEQKARTASGTAQQPSWWQRMVVHQLEAFLRRHFGAPAAASSRSGLAGNVGVVFFHLSRPPQAGGEIAVNFGIDTGDKSIALVEGSRFAFHAGNWNRPMMAVIQLDPKLRTEASALFHGRAGNLPLAWSLTFFLLAGMFVLFFAYHKAILPCPAADRPGTQSSRSVLREFFLTFAAFFKKRDIGVILAFLLLYRFAEAQLVKMASPFLLDAREAGGLALTTGQVGFVYGTVGIIALTLGGLLGGFVVARQGLKFWLWPMVLAINVPDAVYVYLAYALPQNFLTINLCVAVEQFGYGFGYTAYMLYMIYVSEGEHKTAHFALCTGLMALGMMLPGMFSGWLQEVIGYQHFFVWVMLATIPPFIIAKRIRLEEDFGRKRSGA
ncbi:MAG: MFS transporter [candidate division KSB1 bacterium]|nr:MFS transporter [candidate division KSB1 bacterium]MDZ7274816.1 MFS transporter [candidate division KSB1 bacterium]MDZ7285641.1 MFS transporter [candidate division KSB1 bacterium]MDZ7298673.1 MFS transporter [candidate division KSB1 bacterium]MDZ7308788.1 MFS transporter [candidate division KSB1 bacterium]